MNEDRILQMIQSNIGRRVKGINETTRDKIAAVIKQGIIDGKGAAELGDDVENATAFDEYRAEVIARTESARVLNESQIESYREFGVETVRAIDGDDDEECAARDGQEFDIDEAMGISDHPNGTLDWVPVVAKASLSPVPPTVTVIAPQPPTGPQEVRVIELPRRNSTTIKTIRRDAAGLIVEVVEQEIEE